MTGGGTVSDGSCAPPAPSRLVLPLTAHLAKTSTSTPGTRLATITLRTSAPVDSIHQAISGPITAPTWSSPRCNPNARPTRGGGVTSPISASRGGVRSPFPRRSTTRSAMTCHAAAARKYPPTISGPRRDGRSASRPAISLTNAAAASAAPSSAPNAAAPPPSTPVTNAGSGGYTISLAKSLRRETAPNSLTCLGSRLLTQAESPADQRDGQAAVREHGVVEGAQRKLAAPGFPKIVPQPEQLTPPDGVAKLIRGPGAVARQRRGGGAALVLQR